MAKARAKPKAAGGGPGQGRRSASDEPRACCSGRPTPSSAPTSAKRAAGTRTSRSSSGARARMPRYASSGSRIPRGSRMPRGSRRVPRISIVAARIESRPTSLGTHAVASYPSKSSPRRPHLTAAAMARFLAYLQESTSGDLRAGAQAAEKVAKMTLDLGQGHHHTDTPEVGGLSTHSHFAQHEHVALHSSEQHTLCWYGTIHADRTTLPRRLLAWLPRCLPPPCASLVRS